MPKERGIRVRYASRETGWVTPIAVNKKERKMIAIATNKPVFTKKFAWGNLVEVGKGAVTRKVCKVPDTKYWRILKEVM